MTASNEPGPTRGTEADGASAAAGRETGDRAMNTRASGSGAHAAESGPPTVRITDSGEAPPWQRGAVRARSAGDGAHSGTERPAVRPPTHAAPPVHVVSGVSGEVPAAREAGSGVSGSRDAGSREADDTKGYARELPDLSAPKAKTHPRGTDGDREPAGNGSTSRSSARVTVSSRARSGPVRASMQVRRIDPWSALKVSGLLSVALFFVWMIAVAILYLVLGGMGVWSKLNSNVGDLLTNAGGSAGELVSAGSIFGGALLIGLVNMVLFTALATLGAMVYNLSTDIVGGVEVTLADRD